MKLVLGGKTHLLPLWWCSPMVVSIKVKSKWLLLEEEGFATGITRQRPKRNILLLLYSPVD